MAPDTIRSDSATVLETLTARGPGYGLRCCLWSSHAFMALMGAGVGVMVAAAWAGALWRGWAIIAGLSLAWAAGGIQHVQNLHQEGVL